MTAIKVVILKCNVCGSTTPPESLIIDDLLHLQDGPPDSVTDARHLAARKGWRHTKSGADLCPACQSAKRAPVKSGGLLSHIPHPHWGHES